MLSSTHRVVLPIVASVLFQATASLAQQPVTTNKSDVEVSIGIIRGTVVNETGQPMAGASVLIRLATPTTTPRTTTSDNDGNFQISNLDRGLYLVSASSPAYVMKVRDPDESQSFYRIGDSVRIELMRGGVITGSVTNSTNEPVVQIHVAAQLIRYANGQPIKGMLPTSGHATTDDRGIYRMYGLQPGTYIVQAAGVRGFSPYQLSPYDFDVPTYAPASTRDNAAEITVRAGEETNVDIRYRGEPGHVVSGTIKNAGNNGANAILKPVGAADAQFLAGMQLPGTRGFAIYGVPNGVYNLIAQQIASQNPSAPELALSEPFRITVKGADITGIELSTKPLATMDGKVVLEPSTVKECEGKRRPLLIETGVTTQRDPKSLDTDPTSYVRAFFSSVSVEKDGTFIIRNLTDGQYAFTPRFFARYWYSRSVTLPSTAKTAGSQQKIDAAKNWTTVKMGDRLTGLTITLAEGAASLRGNIANTDTAKLSDTYDVYLVPAEKEKAEDVLRYFVVAVEAEGVFNLDSLPPGRYWILLQPRTGSDRLTTVKLQLPDASENRLKIRRAAESAKTEVELKPCQQVTDYHLPLEPGSKSP